MALDQIDCKQGGELSVFVRKHFESFESFVIQSGDLNREGHHDVDGEEPRTCRVHILQSIAETDGTSRSFNLAKDLELLAAAFNKIGNVRHTGRLCQEHTTAGFRLGV